MLDPQTLISELRREIQELKLKLADAELRYEEHVEAEEAEHRLNMEIRRVRDMHTVEFHRRLKLEDEVKELKARLQKA